MGLEVDTSIIRQKEGRRAFWKRKGRSLLPVNSPTRGEHIRSFEETGNRTPKLAQEADDMELHWHANICASCNHPNVSVLFPSHCVSTNRFRIPNLPFFYLVFRAWSHWRALSGSKHIEFLLQNKLITPKPSKILDLIYANGNQPFGATPEEQTKQLPNSESNDERMIIHKSEGKQIAEALGMPELDIELDRAIWQVGKSIQAEKKLKEEKALEKAKEGEKEE